MSSHQPAPTAVLPPEERHYGTYPVVVAVFCCLLLISNVAAVKLIGVGPFTFDGGAVLFPLTYIVDDVLSEIFGFKLARRAILLGFCMSAVASLAFWAAQSLPADPSWGGQAAFVQILGFVPRIVAASLCGYIMGQLLNSWVLVKIKERFGLKHLWVRLIGSTLVGEAADTLAFCTIAFYGVLKGWHFVNYVAVGYCYKCGLEVVMLPVTYQVVRLLRRLESRARS
jgi:uncharacterized integral membrane protein (TIGR00697 family)